MLIDLDHLDRVTDGDRVLRHALLVLFRTQVHGLLAIADGRLEALPAGDTLGDTVHRLRGAAQAVGAGSLATALAGLERTLNADPAEDATAVLVSLRPTLQGTASDVDSLIAACDPGSLAKAGESG
jgi:HPt (histidine-containing phosphotransfer) domain-containing protein